MRNAVALSMMIACLCVAPALAIPPTPASIEPFTRLDSFEHISISPDGKYLALSVPIKDYTSLVVLDAATLKQVSAFTLEGKSHVHQFWWVGTDRLLFSVAQKQGMLDEPVGTGELFATDADGKNKQLLFGYRAESASTGTLIQSNRKQDASAQVISLLPGDPGHVLIAVTPWSWSPGQQQYTSIEKLDVLEGHRVPVGTVPLPGASILVDHMGRARFASGLGSDDLNRVYYREDDAAQWVLINDASVSHRVMRPLGFSPDNAIAYLEATEATGPDSIQRFDTASRTLTPLLVDKAVNPSQLLYSIGARRDPIGVIYEDAKPRVTYFDPDSEAARTHRGLMESFGGDFVIPISSTGDGGTELLESYSDRNPGDIYRYDTVAKKAALLVSRRDWFDPSKMAESKPFEFKARDGMTITGYVTVPHGSSGKALPMVVYPHGGPFGLMDTWRFNTDVQLLAAHGYAVLQVNFRGSGNRGDSFKQAGFRQWGGKMQDDLTDATRWAIESGTADKDRICIYGASYGGYAALMGVAKEPALYRCAVGYAGVYDLEMMYRVGDIQRSLKGKSQMEIELGTEGLQASSPANLADRIKVPVLLAAGGSDQRAPIEQTREMEAALKKAGVPVQTLVYPNEGHGFYDVDHVTEFDRQLLEFLDQHIGSGAEAVGAR